MELYYLQWYRAIRLLACNLDASKLIKNLKKISIQFCHL